MGPRGAGGRLRLVRITSATLIAAWSEFLDGFGPSAQDSFVVESPRAHVGGRAAALLLPLLYGAAADFPEHPAAVDEAMAEVVPTLSIALPQRWETRAAALRGGVQQSGPIHRWAFRASRGAHQKMNAERAAGRPSPLPRRAGAVVGAWLVLGRILSKNGLHQLRRAATGGRNVAADVLEFWRAMGVPLVEFYGTTEAGGLIAYQAAAASGPGTGLRPPSTLELQIGDDGQIEVRGAGLGRVDDGDRSSAAPGDGWVATGDRGKLDANGELTLSYRLSDLALVESRDVPVGDIERLLRNRGYVLHAAVICRDLPFLIALVDLDMPGVAAWARANSVPYGSLNSLARTPEGVAPLQTIVDRPDVTLAAPNMPPGKEYAVLDTTEGFEQTDVLALTGEVRRDEVEKRYAAIVDRLYSSRHHDQAVPTKSEAKA